MHTNLQDNSYELKASGQQNAEVRRWKAWRAEHCDWQMTEQHTVGRCPQDQPR